MLKTLYPQDREILLEMGLVHEMYWSNMLGTEQFNGITRTVKICPYLAVVCLYFSF